MFSPGVSQPLHPVTFAVSELQWLCPAQEGRAQERSAVVGRLCAFLSFQMLDRADIQSQASFLLGAPRHRLPLNSNKQHQESRRKNMHDIIGETETDASSLPTPAFCNC